MYTANFPCKMQVDLISCIINNKYCDVIMHMEILMISFYRRFKWSALIFFFNVADLKFVNTLDLRKICYKKRIY